MEFIIAHFQKIDIYTVISFGVLFSIVFITIIYKQKTNTKQIIELEEIETSEINNTQSKSFEQIEKSTQDESAKMVWLMIDIVSILVIMAISYVLYFKKTSRGIVDCLIISIGGYYGLIKPILFNTNPK